MSLLNFSVWGPKDGNFPREDGDEEQSFTKDTSGMGQRVPRLEYHNILNSYIILSFYLDLFVISYNLFYK